MREKNIEQFETENKVEGIVAKLTENLKGLIDTKMIVGEKITVGEVTVLPVSKLSVGFVSGGGEYDKKSDAEKNIPFAGGSGAGYSVSPVGFVVIQGTSVKMIKIAPNELTTKIVEILPEVVDAINKNLRKD